MIEEHETQVEENTKSELEVLVEELNDYKDKYYRASAETENIKKRVEKEKSEIIKFANDRLVSDILDTLDNFDNALETDMSDDIRQGIELIYKGLKKALFKNGITEIEYDSFTPDLHEAISKGEGDEITTIHRKGYFNNGRLLRAALVSVGR